MNTLFLCFHKELRRFRIGLFRMRDIEWSQFRNWGAESNRCDAVNCFYPVLVKKGQIIGFGDVCKENVHPDQTVQHGDVHHVYPIDNKGIERKWRYARHSVENISHLLKAKKTKSRYEIYIGKNFGLHKTVWNDKRYDANEYGTKIVKELVPDSPFNFPKSLWWPCTIQYLLLRMIILKL